VTEQPFPQRLTDDALDRCIAACEAGGGPRNYEEWAYMEMLNDERQNRKDDGRWRTDEDDEESNGDSAR